MPTKLTVTLLVSIMICGCSTTATISRTNGRELEAKIQRSTSGALVVQTNAGSEARIPRSEITDIDHPGNAAAIVGGLLIIYGGINIAAGVPKCSDNGGAYCTGVFLPAVVGSSLLIWGLSTWIGSSNAASPPVELEHRAGGSVLLLLRFLPCHQRGPGHRSGALARTAEPLKSKPSEGPPRGSFRCQTERYFS